MYKCHCYLELSQRFIYHSHFCLVRQMVKGLISYQGFNYKLNLPCIQIIRLFSVVDSIAEEIDVPTK